MQRSFIYLKDTTSGAALIGVAISFFSPGTTVPVTLYDPNSALDTPVVAINNPVITDTEGFAAWAIPDGDYDVMFQGGSLTQRTIRRMNFFDSSTFTLSGGGSVTSVALSLPAELTVAGSPITTNGTLVVSWASGTGTAAQGKFIGTPTGGGAGAYVGRILAASDIPSLDVGIITSGALPTLRGGSGYSLTGIKAFPVQWSLPCKAVYTANINTANPGTAIFDSVTLTSGQRLLLTGQVAPAQNGPWVFNGSGSALTRPEDFVSGSVTMAYEDRVFPVTTGTVYTGSFWRISTSGAITIDTTGIAFTRVNVAPFDSNNLLPTLSGGSSYSLSSIAVFPVQWSMPVKAVNIANINTANPGTAIFDGTTLSNGQRLLLAGQTAPAENGPWMFNGAGVALSRTEDYAGSSLTMAYEDRSFYVETGTVYAGTIWKIATTGVINIGVTNVTLSQVVVAPLIAAAPASIKSGVIVYDTTQQRLMAGVGSSPANFPTYIPGYFASGTGGNTALVAQTTTLPTTLLGTTTIPANTLKVGSVILFRQYIAAVGLTATPGFAFFLPGSVITTVLPLTAAVTALYCVEVEAIIKTIGAGGTMDLYMSVSSAVNTTGASLIVGNVATNVVINTSTSNQVDHQITLTGRAAGQTNFGPWQMKLIN